MKKEKTSKDKRIKELETWIAVKCHEEDGRDMSCMTCLNSNCPLNKDYGKKPVEREDKMRKRYEVWYCQDSLSMLQGITKHWHDYDTFEEAEIACRDLKSRKFLGITILECWTF